MQLFGHVGCDDPLPALVTVVSLTTFLQRLHPSQPSQGRSEYIWSGQARMWVWSIVMGVVRLSGCGQYASLEKEMKLVGESIFLSLSNIVAGTSYSSHDHALPSVSCMAEHEAAVVNVFVHSITYQ
jgi:hypothetical protein